MEIIHSKDLIHRDFFSNNIIVVKKGEKIRLKVIDFGLAKEIKNSDDIKTKNPGLNPFYRPPEFFKDNIFDEKSDIYSLGKKNKKK